MPRLHGYREQLNVDVEGRLVFKAQPRLCIKHLPTTPPDLPHDDFPTARIVRWNGRR